MTEQTQRSSIHDSGRTQAYYFAGTEPYLRRPSWEDLSQQLNVSIDTVRRDLKALDRAGLVQYIRGGAKAVHESHQFAHFNGRKVIHNELKREAARKAVQLIQPNDLVMLNSGTTTTILAEEIAQADLTCSIVTNNIAAAEAAAANPKCRIHLLGGDWGRGRAVHLGKPLPSRSGNVFPRYLLFSRQFAGCAGRPDRFPFPRNPHHAGHGPQRLENLRRHGFYQAGPPGQKAGLPPVADACRHHGQRYRDRRPAALQGRRH